jgi:hypothetical protein
VTKRRLGAKRGRPPKDWCTDPDRFAIAIAMGLQAVGNTENAALTVVAVHVLGLKSGEHVMVEPRRKRGIGVIAAGTRVASYERRRFLGQRTTTFMGYTASIRLKRDRWLRDPKAAVFLRTSQALIAKFLLMGIAAGDGLESLVKLLCIFADRAVKESRPPEYYTRVSGEPTRYPVQQRREPNPMTLTAREVYAALENPLFTVPEARACTTPPGSPKHISVLIVEDEVAEEIKLDPKPFASALRGQIAGELAKLICEYWGTRVSESA